MGRARMAFDAEFQTWWDRLSEANRTRLKTAAGDDVLRRATTRPAADRLPTGPHRNQVGDPIGPMRESQREIAWNWRSRCADSCCRAESPLVSLSG